MEFSTIPATCISESCIKIKMWSLKMKIFVGPQKVSWRPSRPLIKPFELPKRSVKIEIELIFLCSSLVGTGNVNNVWLVSSLFVGWYVCLSGGKKCSFFGKFGLLWFFVTSVLRFFLLPYHQRFFLYLKGKKKVSKNTKQKICFKSFYLVYLKVSNTLNNFFSLVNQVDDLTYAVNLKS